MDEKCGGGEDWKCGEKVPQFCPCEVGHDSETKRKISFISREGSCIYHKTLEGRKTLSFDQQLRCLDKFK